MENKELAKVFRVLRSEALRLRTPAVTAVYETTGDPFRVLISCIISLRTKDDVTAEASKRLFAKARTPATMAKLETEELAKLIYPAGFYNVKAAAVKKACRAIVDDYGSVVPDEIDELLMLKGVGRKTANLVVTIGYGKPGICVDTHVHRITNRWGYVKTKKADDTEVALREKLPRRYWIPINDLLVAYGQNICKPVSPLCSKCKLYGLCKRVGVGKRR